MDLKNQQKFTVALRLLEDETLDQYSKSVQPLSNHCVQIIESPSLSSIEGFIKKDKLSHSPDRSFQSVNEGSKVENLITVFNFDKVFTSEQFDLEPNQNYFVLNIGKGDTLMGKNGLIFKSIRNGLKGMWSVKVSCGYFNQGKIMNYLDGAVQVKKEEEVENLLNFEYFNLKKLREVLVITCVEMEKQGVRKVAQFVDLLQPGKIADVLMKVLMNTENNEKIQGEEAILEKLSALALSPKILVIGSIYPVLPYVQQSKIILQYISQIYENKTKINTEYTKILLDELQKQIKYNTEASKNLQNSKLIISDLQEQKKENEIENSKIKEKIHLLSSDIEMSKLTQEINLFREKYLFKLAEISELESKIKDLTDINVSRKELFGENRNNKENFRAELFKSDVLSQDIGISPIRSLSLTEKTAVDRIESLMFELETTKKELKGFRDIEEIMKFQLPEHGVEHLSYYELITGLWRLIESMQMHYNEIFQDSIQKNKVKFELMEQRDRLLRKKIERAHEIHVEKLREFQSRESEFEKIQISSNEATEKYKKLKEKHKSLKNQVSVFKAECKEKLKKARADIDIRKQLEECEKLVKKQEEDKENIKNECENDKIEFLTRWHEEKKNLVQEFENEKNRLFEEINILRELREPISRPRGQNS